MIDTLAGLCRASAETNIFDGPRVFGLSAATPDPGDDFWYNPVGHRGYTGRYVTEDTAWRASAFYAGMRVIAETLAACPFNCYQRLAKGGKEIASDHPVHYIIHTAPNEELTAFEFWEMQLSRCITWGNAVSKIDLDTKNNVTALIPLDPAKVDIERDRETGVRFYRHRRTGEEPEILLEEQVLHIPSLIGGDGTKGHSPIALMREPIALFLAVEEYQARFFGNNAVPGGYISHPGVLSPTAKKNLVESWTNVHGGLQGSHKWGVLDEGMKVETVPIEFAKQQFWELRKYQTEEIARILRVPLHLIQSLDRATNNNIEHQSIDFVMHTILPWARRIEQRCNKALFGPREAATYFAEFNLDGLLRGDSAARAALYSARFAVGSITPNEIRRKENDSPIEDPAADKLYVQGAMVPIDMAGAHLQQAQEAK